MLQYNQQYDISNGLFLTYDRQMDHRLLHTSHGQGVRDKMKTSFPYQKFESRTRETFILACVYIMFKLTPSSYRAMVVELKEIEMKDISKFKHDIVHYKDFMQQDIKYLIKNYGGVITSQNVLNEYINGKIKFYTVWFYYKLNPAEDIEALQKSRVFSHIYRKLTFIMLFLTFSEDAVKEIKQVFNQMEL